MIRNLSILSKSLIRISAYKYHRDADDLPRQFNFKWTKEQKKLLFPKSKRFKTQQNFSDPLILPGEDTGEITYLYEQFMTRQNLSVSPQNVAMLIYMFIQHKVMSIAAFDRIQTHAYKNSGQYKIRHIFGCLYGSIIYDRTKMIKFFIQEYQASQKKFTIIETLELVEALNRNTAWTLQQKQKFWEENLKEDFKDAIKQVNRLYDPKIITKFYDQFLALQDYDQIIWNQIIGFMERQKKWFRVEMMQKLYAISGTFQKAQKAFEVYYEELSSQDEVLRRYNFSEMREYTPKQLIALADQNQAQYFPKNYTIVPEGHDPAQWNQIYEEWLKKGSVKQEEEIIRDKSQSFGYAIKDRYLSMKQDDIDLSTLSKQEFIQLFGSYQIAREVIGQNQIDEEIQGQEQQEEGQNEDQ